MRRLILVAALLSVGCGGSPTGPSPITPPVIPTTVSLSGRITRTLTDEPVVGASLSIGGRTVTTNADGRWSIDGQTRNVTVLVEISAAGYLTRNTAIKTADGRTDVDLDLILNGGAFSLDFYRQMVRNAHEQPASIQMLRRWTVNPSVYVDTRIAGGTALLSDAEIEVIRQHAAFAIEAVSNGSLRLDRFETAAGSRAQTIGWINVSIDQDLTQNCGTAIVGANPGLVTFNYNRCLPECSGIGIRHSTVRHEFAHALGLWHHGTAGLMGSPQPVSPCGATATFTPAELYHARIAYSRQPGNLDIDRDGSGVALLSGLSAPVVQCFR